MDPSSRVGASSLLGSVGLPLHEARRLLATVLGVEPGQIGVVSEADGAAVASFQRLAARRREGEPLQYLEGTLDFGPVRIRVDSRALIPRPETEQMWELAMKEKPAPAVAVDLCTGSGALALAIKQVSPSTRVVGSDLARAALDLAAANASVNGLEVEWRQGDLYSALPDDLAGAVDLIVSNPPYVAADEWTRLPLDVRWEPRAALVAGPDGLEVIERVMAGARGWLAPGGVMVCEIGETQGEAVSALMAAAGLAGTVEADLTGRARFAVGRRA
jgi:release factor glutamine methyltransferase